MESTTILLLLASIILFLNHQLSRSFQHNHHLEIRSILNIVGVEKSPFAIDDEDFLMEGAENGTMEIDHLKR